MTCLLCGGVIGACACGWVRDGATWTLPGNDDALLLRLSALQRPEAAPHQPLPLSSKTDNPEPTSRLLTTGEVSRIFRVNPKTVSRWVAKGLLPAIRTPGGRNRYREHHVRALLHNPRT